MSVANKISIKRLLQWRWSAPLTIFLFAVIVAGLLYLYGQFNSEPMQRKSLAMMIMPFAILCSGLLSPFYFLALTRLSFKGVRILTDILIISSIVILSSYTIGWIYFSWILDVPVVPEGIWRFIIPELLTISLPSWMMLLGLGWMMKLREEKLRNTLLTTNESKEKSDQNERISATHGNKVFSIDPEEVIWAKSEGNYVKLFTQERFYLKHSTLNNFLQLAAGNFLRVHKSHLVNLNYVESYSSLDHGDLEITLKTGDRVKCSRSFSKTLREAIGR